MGTKLDVYEQVTNRVIESLEKGVIPWRKGWSSSLPPMNLNSKRRYSGLNSFLLGLTPYKSPYWCTFKGAQAAGGSVKKGEKGTLVIFWRILEVDDPQAKNGKKKIPLLRGYTVFNAEQCENITVPETKTSDFSPVEEAQAILDNTNGAPEIIYGGNDAFYNPVTDQVCLPEKHQFHSVEDFYGTAFHELVHSTGHSSRLGRVTEWSKFGTDPYAKEELVAEMGASLLCAITGVTNDTATYANNAAYIKGWLKALNSDKKLLVSAASQAQKAADYLLVGDVEEND